jgi:hypothetical protein
MVCLLRLIQRSWKFYKERKTGKLTVATYKAATRPKTKGQKSIGNKAL